MSISTWIHTNLSGGGADYAKIPVGPDAEEQKLQKDVDQIKDRVDHLKEPVNVSVQAGYNDLSMRDKAILGASGGAVVGAGLGALKGILTASAPMTVNANWQTHAITQPTLSFDPIRMQVPGVTQVATANGLQDVTVPNAAVRYHFEPTVGEKPIGEYKTPGNVNVQHDFTTNSLVGAAEGAAIGAVGGVAFTAGYLVLRHLRGQDAQPGKTPTNVDFGNEKKTIAMSGAAGAAIGGLVGAADGLLEKSRAGAVQTIQWDTPIIKHEVIGSVPKDASILIRQDVRYDQNAFTGSQVFNDPNKFKLDDYTKHGPKVDVQGDVPQKNLLGSVKMEHHTQDVTSSARYGVATTVVGGIVLGGLVGVAAGIAINVIRKIVDA